MAPALLHVSVCHTHISHKNNGTIRSVVHRDEMYTSEKLHPGNRRLHWLLAGQELAIVVLSIALPQCLYVTERAEVDFEEEPSLQ